MDSNAATLTVYLLGTFRVVADGREVRDEEWQRRKARSLVKLLALQPQRRMHREQLIEALYPELEPEQGGSNLHRMVHLARRALEPGLARGAQSRFIQVREGHVSLEAPGGVATDLEEFERRAADAFKSRSLAACEAALALYAGELLADDPYEDWARARREQAAALYHELLGLSAQVYELEGMRAEAVECYRRLTSRNPTDEEAHRQLMRLYALAGDRGQAARQYRTCEEAVARELGVRPERATVELHRQIGSGEVAAGASAVAGRGLGAAARRGPKFQQLTFRRGTVREARCRPDGSLFVCAAGWEGRPAEVYSMRAETREWLPLGLGGAAVFAVSRTGELAVGLRRRFVRGFVTAGALACVPPRGAAPPVEVLDGVQ